MTVDRARVVGTVRSRCRLRCGGGGDVVGRGVGDPRAAAQVRRGDLARRRRGGRVTVRAVRAPSNLTTTWRGAKPCACATPLTARRPRAADVRQSAANRVAAAARSEGVGSSRSALAQSLQPSGLPPNTEPAGEVVGATYSPMRCRDDASTPTDERLMALAIERAREAEGHGDVPIGAVVARDGEPLAAAGNERELRATRPPTPRSSRSAPPPRRSGGWRLPGTTLYVTLEPCAMCAGRDRPRPHPGGRLRCRRPQGRRRRQRPRRPRRARPQPPPPGHRRRARGRVRRPAAPASSPLGA